MTVRNKILICTNHSYMLYQFRKELIEELMKDSEVVLSMPFVGHEEDFMGMGLRCIEVQLNRRSMNPFSDLKLLASYKDLLKREQPDKVITYSIKPNLYMGILCKYSHIPYYMNVQGLGTAFEKPVLSKVAGYIYKKAADGAQCVFFENTNNAAYFLRHGLVEKSKIHIFHGAGVNLDQHSFCPMPSNNKVRFLYLGRIMKEKGMNELFQAVERLHEDGDEFFLDMVGFFEEEEHYKDRMAELMKKGILNFYGFKDNPDFYYRQADCIVMPSYHEGMSNVNLEAAATGRCVITTDIPGCREAVDHEKTGFLVKKASTGSLYKAMKRFLQLEPTVRAEMGEAGRRKMEREFDRRHIVKETKRWIG